MKKLKYLFVLIVGLWGLSIPPATVMAKGDNGSSSTIVLKEPLRLLREDGLEIILEAGSYEVTDGDFSSIYRPTSSETIKNQIAIILQENPDLILEALQSRSQEVYALAQRGGQEHAAELKHQRRLSELRDPFHPELLPSRPVRGNPDAPITIVEYSDFECPYCAAAHPTIKTLLKRFAGQVRFFYKHNPLAKHPLAEPAARYFEAIALQDQKIAWQFHDQLFEQQDKLQEGHVALETIVSSLPVNHQRLKVDLQSEVIAEQIRKDLSEAEQFGFDGTPAFLINGVSLRGAYPEEDFVEIIHMFLDENK